MKTKATEFIYQDTIIHFALSTNKNVMVNATEMAKAFNKRIDHFLKTEPTKRFIKLLEFPPQGVNSSPLKKKEIISTHGQNGTYFTKLLAIKFAMWLDPVFELWVIHTIDEIMFGEYRIHEQAMQETLQAEKEIEQLQVELAQNPAFQRIQTLEKFIKTKDAVKRKVLKDKKNQIAMDFASKN